MDFKTAIRRLVFRAAFVAVWAVVILIVFLNGRGSGVGVGELPAAMLGFGGFFIAIFLFSKSIGDFVAASANKANQS
ncbi:hypothetical protein [Brucella oryzae]|uniref:hypothetical protein n=1 Tax=Brucella oryzae TaxID=335286 RepID=UPI0035BC91ED